MPQLSSAGVAASGAGVGVGVGVGVGDDARPSAQGSITHTDEQRQLFRAPTLTIHQKFDRCAHRRKLYVALPHTDALEADSPEDRIRQEHGSNQVENRVKHHEAPNGWLVSGERGGEADERVRCTRVLGRALRA